MMSGVSVIWYLLKTNSPVLAVVPAARIMAGDMPLKTVLPAICVKQISSVPFNLIRTNESNRMHTDRVQVSTQFKSPDATPAGTGYPGLKALMKLVLAACPGQRGTVNGVVVDSITPGFEGPDLYDDAIGVHSLSRDFLIRWIST